LLCTALLQLRLKQDCVAAVEAPEPPANCSPADSDTIAGLMIPMCHNEMRQLHPWK